MIAGRTWGTRPGRLIGPVLAAILSIPLVATPAAATITCTFNAVDDDVDVFVSDDPTTDEDTFFIAVRASDNAIMFGSLDGGAAQPCGAATTTNTDRIDVAGSPGDESFEILQARRFAPGATSEGFFPSEIEIAVELFGGTDRLAIGGTPQADSLVVGDGSTAGAGGGAVAFNTDFDADIIFSAEVVRVAGDDGADRILAQGTAGTGPPYPGATLLQGGPGGDTVTGGPGPDVVHGDAGRDTLSGALGEDDVIGGGDTDTVEGGPNDDDLFGNTGQDTYRPGAGNDTIRGVPNERDTLDLSSAPGPVTVILQNGTAFGEGTDTFSAIDNVLGSPFGDTLNGSATQNFIGGGRGDDSLAGAQESDFLAPGVGRDDVRGGSGADHVGYGDLPFGMVVDLVAGRAAPSDNGSTAETDSIATIEHVAGTRFDDQLFGSAVSNTLSGLDGNDDLFGREGDDTLFGGLGNDDLDGGPGTDTCIQDVGAGALTSCDNVGTFELKPRRAEVLAGEPVDYLLTWTHPRRWRQLDTVELRVRDGDRVLAWVRWNQEGNTFQLFDPRADRFGPAGAGGSRGTLDSPFAVLHLRGSDGVAFDTRTIAVLMRLSFRPAAAGDHVVEATAEDDRNNRMAWERAGTLKVVAR